MKYFELNHKTQLCFGAGAVAKAGNYVKELGCHKVFLMCDDNLLDIGIVDKVTNSLNDFGVENYIYTNVQPNPRDIDCEEAAIIAKREDVDGFVAIGGGSVMDAAKATNVLLTNGGDCEKWAKLRKIEKDILPLICIPTTAGTGSEVTFEAVITNTNTHVKMSLSDKRFMAPDIAILDPELTITLPALLTATTGLDALTHAIEAYTCKAAHPISDSIALAAIDLLAGNILKASSDGKDIEARGNMLIGSVMAGIAFTNSYLGAVHSLAEIIGGFYDTPHGIACSIFLPYITEYNIPSNIKKHAKIALSLGADDMQSSNDAELARKGIERLFDFNRKLNIPSFKDINKVNKNDFTAIADACIHHGCTNGNSREIGNVEYLEILNRAYMAK